MSQEDLLTEAQKAEEYYRNNATDFYQVNLIHKLIEEVKRLRAVTEELEIVRSGYGNASALCGRQAIQIAKQIVELGEVRAELAANKEYIAYLVKCDNMTAGYLFTHGWKFPNDLILEGDAIRHKMNQYNESTDRHSG